MINWNVKPIRSPNSCPNSRNKSINKSPPPPSSSLTTLGIHDADTRNIEALEAALNDSSRCAPLVFPTPPPSSSSSLSPPPPTPLLSTPHYIAERFHKYISRLDEDSIDYLATTNSASDSFVAITPVSEQTFTEYSSRMAAWRQTLKKGDEVEAGDGITYETVHPIEHHFKLFKAKVIALR